MAEVAGAAAAGVTTGRATGGVATGRAEGGVATGRMGAPGAAACCFCRMAFRTSPGLAMFERSNLGFSSSTLEGLEGLGELSPPLGTPKWARILRASSFSRELECVFFSTIPISSKTSRMALLFTSSSRAKSLIRIFCCIRPLISCKSHLAVHGTLSVTPNPTCTA